MRTALALSGFLLLSAVLLAHSSPCSGEESPTSSTPPLTVVLTNGDTLRAIRILPSGIDMLRVDDDAGRAYHAASHIRRVLDETGADRTRDALDRRRFLGRPLPPEPVRERPGRPSRFGPLAVARTFPITETAVFLAQGKRLYDRRQVTFTFDLGRGMNIGARDAIGMSVFGGAGGGAYDLGVRYRYRRWLGPRASVDVGPGLILVHDEPDAWEGRGVGLVGQVSLNATPWLSFGAQAFTVGRKLPGSYGWYGSYPTIYDRDSGLMFGLKLGGAPGLLAGVFGSIVALSNPHPGYSQISYR